MRKIFIIVSILLFITLGLLWRVHLTVNKVYQVHQVDKVDQFTSGTIKITFLDVGQGDASFIEFPGGGQMLVDCAVDARILEALGRVMPYYDRDLDYLVISHPDLDHYGGCIDVLTQYNVKNIVYNGMQKPSDKAWQWFWDLVQKEGAIYHELRQEEIWDIASTTVHFYYPSQSVKELIKTDLYKNYNGNNLSIIMGLESVGHQVLFTGDAETDLEKYLVSTYNNKLKSDILKVGHHGSSNSSNKDFLAVVQPAYTVISVGKENKFGHPTLRVLKRLERTNAQIFRTDLQGDIICEVGERIVCE